ncbi:MAG: c-type cytochrome [Pirellulales bacterium]
MAGMLGLGIDIGYAQDKGPLVGGFERIGRHGEASERLAGALLITELRCTACHASEVKTLAPALAPSLQSAGLQMNRSWVKRFLEDPHGTKPGTTMPSLLKAYSEEERSRIADCVAAYLQTQVVPLKEPKASGANPVAHEFWKQGNIEEGSELFHRVGCVACHEPDALRIQEGGKVSAWEQLLEELEPEQIEEMGLAHASRTMPSIPLPQLSAKYTPKSLTLFLLDPASTRPSGRMPLLKLTPSEASHIAAYLMKSNQGVSVASEDRDNNKIEEGRKWFQQLKCSACHPQPDADRISAKPLSRLDANAASSCIDRPSTLHPSYGMDSRQVDIVRHWLLNHSQHSKPLGDEEHRTLTLAQYNCFACHEREGLGGVAKGRTPFFETAGHVDLGDEGRLPPSLTGVERKLQPNSLTKVLTGAGDIRPYLQIRMPLYAANDAKVIAAHLTSNLEKDDRPNIAGVPEGESKVWIEAGRLLADTGCVQCHAFRGEALPSTVGVDLANVGKRLNEKWFREFLLNPVQLKKRTRMPTFFSKENRNLHVLEGDIEKQIGSLWFYLNRIEESELPAKIAEARSINFELIPKESPIVMRTFMKDSGFHAIAIGFPNQLSMAWDAERFRVGEIWKGKFLDAKGTWFDRFSPPAEPLSGQRLVFSRGADLYRAKNGVPNPSDESYRFQGYRLDDLGNPIILYSIGHDEVETSYVGSNAASLQIGVSVNRKGPSVDAKETPPLWIKVLESDHAIQHVEPNVWKTQEGLTLTFRATEDSVEIKQVMSQARTYLVVQLKDAIAKQLKWELQW